MTPALTVVAENVSLSYPVYGGPQMTLRGMIADRLYFKGRAKTPKHVAALKDISFETFKGDRVALIGPNGAGKSTLLRLISDIYQPDLGKLNHFGTVLPLLGALPGISSDASGYENIKLAVYSIGLARDRLADVIAEVEEFSQLGDFLSLPLKTYSSGMVARLFFAVLTSLTADIFVMDEFSFATGDASFKERAQKRARNLLERASTVFIASHDSDLLRNTCNKAIYLKNGTLAAFGPFEDVLRDYEKDIAAQHG